jgi:hypothetical protein
MPLFRPQPLEDEVYVELPEMFRDEQDHGSKDKVILKLHKSLYRLVQVPQTRNVLRMRNDPHHIRGQHVVLWSRLEGN